MSYKLKSLYQLLILTILFGIMLLITGYLQNFYQFHNDFWDVFFVARNMDIGDHASWFNPQYPIGYTLLLKLISGTGSPVVPAILFNIACGMGILFSCGCFYTRFFDKKFLVNFLTGIIALYPTLFHYFSVGGGDPGSVLFFSIGSFLVLHSLYTEKRNLHSYILSGVLMGIGALFRYHLLPGSVLLVLSLLPLYIKQWRLLFLTICSLFAAYSPQIIVNLLTGHGPLETQFGPMNVYDLMYQMSWYQTITLDMPSSVITIIMNDPMLFLQKYAKAFLSFFPGYLPAIFAAIFVKAPDKKRLSMAMALFTIIYFGLFSATTSGRQILITLPIALLCCGFLIEHLLQHQLGQKFISDRTFTTTIYSLCLMLLLFLSFKDFKKNQGRMYEQKQYSKLESVLLSSGCTSVKHVFSSDFNFYIPSLYPHITWFNGGAPRWGTYKLNDEYPEFPVSTIDEFVAMCKIQGVSFVVLTDNCALLSPWLFEVFSEKKYVDVFSLLYEDQNRKLFKINW